MTLNLCTDSYAIPAVALATEVIESLSGHRLLGLESWTLVFAYNQGILPANVE